MEEESEIIFSLSKAECQLNSDCGPPMPEDLEYSAQEYLWDFTDCNGNHSGWVEPGSGYKKNIKDIVELKCGDGRWYDGWYSCENHPQVINPPWGGPVCRCAEPSDETDYGMPEGWYESVGKNLLVFFACGWQGNGYRTGDPADFSTWSTFIDGQCSGIGIDNGGLSFGWGFLGAIGDPPRSDDYEFTAGEGELVYKLGGGFCCNNECQYCPCLYEVCPMEQSRIDPPIPECFNLIDDAHFCVPEGWNCLMYRCAEGKCSLVNGWQAINCVDLICNYCGGEDYTYIPPCIQPAFLIDKGACLAQAGCGETSTDECTTVQMAGGTNCQITGAGCPNGQSCSKDPDRPPPPDGRCTTDVPSCQCSCRASYLSSRLVKDFNWKGESPP